ncbi:MAG TPA: O-antigen ligase family protein [Armatimonadota bacterium]|nr:O-antigen ligase family protein [Armatimonadota bacterium]
MTAARAMLYLAAGAAGVGVSLALSAQAPLLRAAPALMVIGAAACAAAARGGRWALALLVVAPFFPIPFHVGAAIVGPPDVAVVLVLLAWGGGMLARGRIVVPRTPGDWALSALVVAALGSTLAVALSPGVVPLAASAKKILQLGVSFVGLYYFVAHAAREPRALRYAVAVFLGVAALEAAYAVLLQFVPAQLGHRGLWPPYLSARASMRAMGTVDAGFGHYMAAAWVLALALAAQGRGRLRVLAAGATPVLLAGLISSGTRGSAAAAGAGLMMLMLLSGGRRSLLAGVAGLAAAVGVAGLVWPGVAGAEKIAFAFTSHGSSDLAVRLLSWKIGWDLAITHPWLGLGPGANALTIEALLGIPADALRYVEGTMNAYLQAFLESGLLGLAGMIAFIAAISGAALTRGARGHPLALGLGAAVFVLGITGLTGPLLIGGIGHLLFTLAGLAAAAAAEEQAP